MQKWEVVSRKKICNLCKNKIPCKIMQGILFFKIDEADELLGIVKILFSVIPAVPGSMMSGAGF
jgi:hypothetical protein